MARNTLKLNTKGLEPLIKKLDSIGGDVKGAVNTALTKAAQTMIG